MSLLHAKEVVTLSSVSRTTGQRGAKMNSLLRKAFLICLLAIPLSLHAQNSCEVIILGPRVGPAIGAQEAKRFGLFTELRDLVGAMFFQVSADSFIARVLLCSDGGTIRDTIIPFSARRLSLIAERVDHIDEIEAGHYRANKIRSEVALCRYEPSIWNSLLAKGLPAILDHTRGKGDRVKVILRSGNSVQGEVAAAGNSLLILQEESEFSTLTWRDVLEVERTGTSKVFIGWKVGVGVGAVAGAVAGVLYGRYNEIEERWMPLEVGFFAGAGALAGLIGGAVIGGAAELIWPAHQDTLFKPTQQDFDALRPVSRYARGVQLRDTTGSDRFQKDWESAVNVFPGTTALPR
jgi:hypothetical protein